VVFLAGTNREMEPGQKVLLAATVYTHLAAFHLPFIRPLDGQWHCLRREARRDARFTSGQLVRADFELLGPVFRPSVPSCQRFLCLRMQLEAEAK